MNQHELEFVRRTAFLSCSQSNQITQTAVVSFVITTHNSSFDKIALCCDWVIRARAIFDVTWRITLWAQFYFRWADPTSHYVHLSSASFWLRHQFDFSSLFFFNYSPRRTSQCIEFLENANFMWWLSLVELRMLWMRVAEKIDGRADWTLNANNKYVQNNKITRIVTNCRNFQPPPLLASHHTSLNRFIIVVNHSSAEIWKWRNAWTSLEIWRDLFFFSLELSRRVSRVPGLSRSEWKFNFNWITLLSTSFFLVGISLLSSWWARSIASFWGERSLFKFRHSRWMRSPAMGWHDTTTKSENQLFDDNLISLEHLIRC